MPRSLKDLKPRDVQRNLAIMKQMLLEVHPQLEVNRGPIHDLVLYYAAAYTTANQQDLADAMQSLNLKQLMQNPSEVSTEVADTLLSKNWNIQRRHGTPSEGTVTVLLERAHGMVLPASFTLTANGHKFVTKEAHTIRAAAGGSIMLPTDRALMRQGNHWAFTIPVTAVTVGASGNLRRGTQLQFNPSYHNIQQIYATQDFSGGADEESNADMLQRLDRSASSKVWSNRCTGEALICGVPALARAAGVSIIGFGDPEMLRDRYSFWPGSIGGRVDVYVKPQGGILMKDVTVQGQIIDGTPEGARWEIAIPRDAAPGFFRVERVQKLGGAKCRILEEVRGVDPTAIRQDIHNSVDAAYSAYQTATLRVLEIGAERTSLSRFIVTLSYLPGIDEAQKLVSDRNTVSLACNVLVKAAVPCFTTIDIEIQCGRKRPTQIAEMQNAVAGMVNSTGFVGRLSTAAVNTVVTPFLDGSSVVRSVNMSGKIRYPNGTTKTLEPSGLLSIPQESKDLVSPRTVAFFQDPADVRVRVVTADDSA